MGGKKKVEIKDSKQIFFIFNEETGDMVQVTEGGFSGMLCVAHYVVTLTVTGPEGSARNCKVWKVCVRDTRHPSNTSYD